MVHPRNQQLMALATLVLIPALIVLLTGPATAVANRVAQVSGSTPGSVGIRLMEAPVNRADDPRARMYIVDYLKPGTAIHRRFEVINTSSRQQHVELYAAAASITNDTFTVAQDRSPDELSGWVSLESPSRDVPAGGSAIVEATIAVPRTAASGERYAVIWAQVSSSPGPGGTVRVVNRVGLRIYLDVGLGGEPASDFRIVNIAAARTADGKPQVVATVHNTGGRALDLSGSLALSDGPGSLSAGPFPASLGLTLGIGDFGAVTVPLSKSLPDGPWTARLTLVSGDVRHTNETRLTFPVRPGQTNPGTAGWADLFLKILIIFAAALIVLLLMLWLILRQRRRTERRAGQSSS